jgi:hypothetical protein
MKIGLCLSLPLAMLIRVLVAHAQNQITETVTVAPAPAGSALALSVAPGGRYLQDGLGSPFLIAGDAAMALFQALPLTGSSSSDASANATFYFSTRSSKVSMRCGPPQSAAHTLRARAITARLMTGSCPSMGLYRPAGRRFRIVGT